MDRQTAHDTGLFPFQERKLISVVVRTVLLGIPCKEGRGGQCELPTDPIRNDFHSRLLFPFSRGYRCPRTDLVYRAGVDGAASPTARPVWDTAPLGLEPR